MSSKREAFQQWLHKQEGGDALYAYLPELEAYAQKRGLCTESVLDSVTLSRVQQLRDALFSDRAYLADDKQKRQALLLLAKQLAAFVAEQLPGDRGQAQNKRIADRRAQFAQWLRTLELPRKSTERYALMLDQVGDFAQSHGFTDQSLYLYEDEEKLHTVCEALLEAPVFQYFNRLNQSVPSVVVHHYLWFRTSHHPDEKTPPVSSTQADKQASTQAATQASTQAHTQAATQASTQVATQAATQAAPVSNTQAAKQVSTQVATQAATQAAPVSNTQAATQATTQADTQTVTRQHTAPELLAFVAWLREQGLTEKAARARAQQLQGLGEYAYAQALEDRALYAICSVRRLQKLLQTLEAIPDLDLEPLRLWIAYCQSQQEVGAGDLLASRCAHILQAYFEDGLQYQRTLHMHRFRQYYEDEYGEALTQSDEELLKTLRRVGVEQDARICASGGGAYIDALDDIQAEIAATFRKGATCIYLSELFARHEDTLRSQLQIFSPEHFAALLTEHAHGAYTVTARYLRTQTKADADGEVRALLRSSHIPMTTQALHDTLWYIPQGTIKTVLYRDPEVVSIQADTWLYIQNLPITDEELQQVSQLLHDQIYQKGFVIDSELRAILEQHCPAVAINTQELPIQGLRKCLAVRLGDTFSFQGPVISSKGEDLDLRELFIHYCQSRDALTTEELHTFAEEIGHAAIPWEAVRSVTVRTSPETLLSRSRIEYDISAIDQVLDELVEGDFLPLSEVRLFLDFPAIGVRWSGFVLESYLYSDSRQFALLQASYSQTEPGGAIVRRSAGIHSFDDLLVRVLGQHTQWETRQDALNLLTEAGYLKRRNYKKIDQIMRQARAKQTK